MAKSNVAQLKKQEAQRRLSKEDLLQPRIVEKEVILESLGGTVLIRSLSHADRAEIRSEAGWGTEAWDEGKFTLGAILRSLKDPQLNEDDLKALEAQHHGIVDELEMHITLLNMLGKAADLKKESSETPSSDSP